MKPFTQLTATAAPLMRANIDTDQIIRINRLIDYPRGELGPYCLEALRFLADGSENPGFAPNAARYRGAAVLVAAENFGTTDGADSVVLRHVVVHVPSLLTSTRVMPGIVVRPSVADWTFALP